MLTVPGPLIVGSYLPGMLFQVFRFFDFQFLWGYRILEFFGDVGLPALWRGGLTDHFVGHLPDALLSLGYCFLPE